MIEQIENLNIQEDVLSLRIENKALRDAIEELKLKIGTLEIDNDRLKKEIQSFKDKNKKYDWHYLTGKGRKKLPEIGKIVFVMMGKGDDLSDYEVMCRGYDGTWYGYITHVDHITAWREIDVPNKK